MRRLACTCVATHNLVRVTRMSHEFSVELVAGLYCSCYYGKDQRTGNTFKHFRY